MHMVPTTCRTTRNMSCARAETDLGGRGRGATPRAQKHASKLRRPQAASKKMDHPARRPALALRQNGPQHGQSMVLNMVVCISPCRRMATKMVVCMPPCLEMVMNMVKTWSSDPVPGHRPAQKGTKHGRAPDRNSIGKNNEGQNIVAALGANPACHGTGQKWPRKSSGWSRRNGRSDLPPGTS